MLDDAEPFAVGEIRMSVRQRSYASRSSIRIASPTDSARDVSSPIRDSVSFEQLEQIRLVIDDKHFGLTTGFSRHGIEL